MKKKARLQQEDIGNKNQEKGPTRRSTGSLTLPVNSAFGTFGK
jgi:hypothetical protein